MDDHAWKRNEARKAADRKLAEAAQLIEEAAEILKNNGYTVSALDAEEALVYIRGAQGV